MKGHQINQFRDLPTAELPRSTFDRPFGSMHTIDSGYLVPIFWEEVLPGDTHILNTTLFGRLPATVVPVMDNIYLDLFFFYVPNRLIWDNFEKFMGAQDNPGDSIDYLEPQVLSGSNGYSRYGILDNLGIVPAVPNVSVTAKFTRAYNLIWNEWFRCEYLQDSVKVDTDDGPDNESDYVLLRRGKRHDYYTTCLPTPVKGVGVELPLSGNVPTYLSTDLYVNGNDNSLRIVNGGRTGTAGQVYSVGIEDLNSDNALYLGIGTPGTSTVGGTLTNVTTSNSNTLTSINLRPTGDSGVLVKQSQNTGAIGYADLSNVTAVTINSLRTAFALQHFLELENRGGSRYTEILQNFFNVKSPDARLQRPEFLGMSTTRIVSHPVAQTSSTDSTTPQANLTAYSTVASTGNGFSRSFVEHGVILGMVCMRTDLKYQQGIDRHFSRKTRYDYAFPCFAHLGEQEVLNKEVYVQGNSADNEVFGYNERYAEYRYRNSYVTGKFRSSDPQSLDVWHMAQNFANLPTLSSDFIEENPPIERVLAVQDEPQLLLDVWYDLTSIRELPMYGTPGLGRL